MAEKGYIDRELIEEFLESSAEGLHGTPMFVELLLHCRDRVKEMPAADVVEVVRCKDCQMWRGKDYDGCCIKNGLATRMANDFCSYGERKEQE